VKIRHSKQKPSILVDVTRSYTYKANIPGVFESRDFFCAQKAQCRDEDAEATSRRLIAFCKAEVMRDVREWYQERHAQQSAAAAARNTRTARKVPQAERSTA
jgi:hypothetical protein